MRKIKYYNRLIIDKNKEVDGHDFIFLMHYLDIKEVVYNDGSFTTLYRLDESGYMVRAEDKLYESDFGELYEKFDESCDSKKEKFMFENYHDDEPQPYVKADWNDYEHYLEMESEHGISRDYYDITNAEIIEGVCYDASGCIPQEYPNTEHQNFFKFVSSDGKVYHIKETHPFFIDEHDYRYELISMADFDKFDNGDVEE